jgi:outer membrane protein assembly factor BamB/enterochelin esterase-like enzyme
MTTTLFKRNAYCRLLRIFFASCLSVAACYGAARAASGDWPAFRGARVDGVVAGAGAFDGEEPVSFEVAWKRPLGKGYSGVVVVEGIAATMFSDGESDFAAAFDSKSGKEKWRYRIADAYKGHDGSDDGPISTPVIVDGRLIGLHPRGKLFALSVDDGKESWTVDIAGRHGAVKPHYGFSTSPIFAGGHLIVMGAKKGALVSGLDPATGEIRWTAGEDAVAYQSPILIEYEGRTRVLAAGNQKMAIVDPADGTILREAAHGGSGEPGAQTMIPIAVEDASVLLMNQPNASALFRMGGKASGAEKSWEEKVLHKTYAIPVYHDGCLFGYTGRILSCIDAANGDIVWRSRAPGDGFVVLVDGYLVCITKSGAVHVGRAGRSSFESRAGIDVFEKTVWTPPSFAEGSIFARSLGEIARIDIVRAAAPPPVAQRVSPMQADISGSYFARFLEKLEKAQDVDAAIDRYIERSKPFPVIEDGGLVHFMYHGEATDVVVTGDMFGLSNEQPMQRHEGTNLFYLSVKLDDDVRANYGIIKDFVAMPDPLNPRKDTCELVGKDMEFDFRGGGAEMSWFAMPGWTAPAHLNKVPAARRGRLEAQTIQSDALEAESTIEVYTPAGYESGDARYAVAYVHAGAGALEHGHLKLTLDNLIGDRMSPVIAVFIHEIPKPPQREAYVKMVNAELIPFVDRTYRTIAEPGARAHVGSGIGALAAMKCAFDPGAAAQRLGVQSPFMIDTTDIEGEIPSADHRPMTIYLDWGRYDLRDTVADWSIAETGRALDKHFREKGYEPRGGEVNDGTGWSSWRHHVDDLLAGLFPLSPKGAT